MCIGGIVLDKRYFLLSIGLLVCDMRSILAFLIVSCLLVLVPYSNSVKVMSPGDVVITKKWEVSFHGEPTTMPAILYVDGGFRAVLGTTLGIVVLDEGGVEHTIHVGGIVVDPVAVGDRAYVAGLDKLYIVSSDGSVESLSIGNIKLLASWGPYIVMCIPENQTTRIVMYDPASGSMIGEYMVSFTVDYVSTGDVDGDGFEDLLLCSRFGRLEILNSSYGDLEYDFGLGFGERINVGPRVGDIDGDGINEAVILTYHELSNMSSRLLIVDVVESGGNTSEVENISLGQRAQALALYDFDGDNAEEIFIGYEYGYYAFNISTGVALFNVSTRGYIEGFGRRVYIGDVDMDGYLEILYIGGKELLVMANSTGIEETLYIPGESIYTFTPIGVGEKIISVSRRGKIIFTDTTTWQISSSYNLLTGPMWGIRPAVFGSGKIAIPLLDGRMLIATEDGALGYINVSGSIHEICCGDIDGDGVDEAVFVEYRGGLSIVSMVDDSMVSHLTSINGTVYGVSLCDLDLDGRDEIIINTGRGIIVNGSVTWQWVGEESLAPIPPVVFDVDNDLRPEIVIPSQEKAVYVLSDSGSIDRRFGITIGINNPLIVGDVNMDRGADYLLYQSGSLYRFDSSGRMLFMVKTSIDEDLYPVITDIDADGFLEIVAGSANNISIYSYRGSLLKYLDLYDEVLGFAIIDVGSDWVQDILVALPGKLIVRNLVTGDDIARPVAIDLLEGRAYIYAGDFNGDGMLEITIVSGGIIYLETNVEVRGVYECYGVHRQRTFNTMNYDRDNDFLTDYEEMYLYGTNPYLRDTDGDGFDDRTEIMNGWDPLDPNIPRKYPIALISLILSIVALAAIICIYELKKRRMK